MKRIIIALAAMLMLSVAAQAQLRYGVRAGYGLNNASFSLKGSSVNINTGYNHGFYVGPELRMNFGDMLGVSAALQFEQLGTTCKVDAATYTENLSDILLNDIKLKEIYGQDTYNYLQDSVVNPAKVAAKGNTSEASIVLYNISLPLSLRGQFGKLGIMGGIDLRYTVSNKVGFTIKQQGQPDITEIILDPVMPSIAYHLDGGTAPGPEATMSLNDFYKNYVKQSFNVGAHIGADYELYDGVALQVVYNWGLSSFIGKPWNKALAAKANSLQVGMSYMF